MRLKKNSLFGFQDRFSETSDITSILVFQNKRDETPVFSIGIPAYRRPERIKEAIESAIKQNTTIPYEIIVVDDYPERNDEVEKVMTIYSNTPCISYYKNSKNLGLAGNWNRLVTLARGKYFVMLHDDDCLAPYYIQTVHDIIKTLPENFGLLQTEKTSSNNFSQDGINLCTQQYSMADNLTGDNLGALSGGTYRRDAIIGVGGWDKEYYPSLDWSFDVKLMSKYPVYKTPTIGLFYRWEDNLSLKKETKQGFIMIDYIIQNGILSYYHIPKIMREIWLEDSLYWRLKLYGLDIEDVRPLTLDKYSPRIKGIITLIVNKLLKPKKLVL